MNKLKTLFLAANPSVTSHLALDEELRDILEKIRAAPHRDAFEMVVAMAARPDDLEQALLEHRPVIVHFSGHGSEVGGLVFHGDTMAEVKEVSAEAIGQMFKLLKKNVRLVILNACYSEPQAQAIVREIDFVVGMKSTIDDVAARRFVASFYRGLGFGETVATAFGLGVNSLQREGFVAEQDVPVLRVRAGVSAEVVLLDPSIAPSGGGTESRRSPKVLGGQPGARRVERGPGDAQALSRRRLALGGAVGAVVAGAVALARLGVGDTGDDPCGLHFVVWKKDHREMVRLLEEKPPPPFYVGDDETPVSGKLAGFPAWKQMIRAARENPQDLRDQTYTYFQIENRGGRAVRDVEVAFEEEPGPVRIAREIEPGMSIAVPREMIGEGEAQVRRPRWTPIRATFRCGLLSSSHDLLWVRVARFAELGPGNQRAYPPALNPSP